MHLWYRHRVTSLPLSPWPPLYASEYVSHCVSVSHSGYIEAVVIPAGARRIKVVEDRPSHSFLGNCVFYRVYLWILITLTLYVLWFIISILQLLISCGDRNHVQSNSMLQLTCTICSTFTVNNHAQCYECLSGETVTFINHIMGSSLHYCGHLKKQNNGSSWLSCVNGMLVHLGPNTKKRSVQDEFEMQLPQLHMIRHCSSSP